SEQKTYKAFDFIISNNANLVLQIYESQDVEIYLNQICKPYAAYLQTSTKLNKDLLKKISYCFDLSTMSIKEIYRNIIKIDRKSTRLNSSHVSISYAVFCLKKKKKKEDIININ